jgi:DNA-binding response OmpR family regulator
MISSVGLRFIAHWDLRIIVRLPLQVVKSARKSCKMFPKKDDFRVAKTYEFGPFRLDTDAEILFSGAQPIVLGQRAVALLRLLLEQAGSPVSKSARCSRRRGRDWPSRTAI